MEARKNMKPLAFARYAWGLLVYTLGVIVWGAYVRATGSGDGCGQHWPTCQGAILPEIEHFKTIIEFSHRISSGLALLGVILLFFWGRRIFAKDHPAYFGVTFTLWAMIVETLAGGGLVLFQLVAYNDSVARVVIMAVHLLITLTLLGAMALTAYWASGGPPLRIRNQGAVGWALGIAVLAFFTLAASGAVTALADTLFRAPSFWEGVKQDLSPTAHFLVQLRVLHPLIAVSVGIYILLMAGVVSRLRPSPRVRQLGVLLVALFGVQILIGLWNMFSNTPVALQMLHLLSADAVWIAFVLFAAAALASGIQAAEQTEVHQPSPHEGGARASVRHYIALTKPRIISLLLFTALAGLFIAAGGWPGWKLFLVVLLGGYASAGAANAINMVIDRDIDAKMERTRGRPTVQNRISSADALKFAFVLAAIAFLVLWWGANLLAATLSLAGLMHYVLIYTLYLKRRSWSNIVIGGAAGAFPPLVGWAAVTGDLNLLAWYLFAIVFFWTPVHFWALALLIKDDYARVGVPMLPVVLGDRVTVIQIALYAVLTAVISIMPLTLGQMGWIYAASAGFLNLVLLAQSLMLYLHPQRPQARRLFFYSMSYLALLFLAMAVDRSVHF